MKALSINQPWGMAIVDCGKDIENRDWPTKYRGEFLIHVGLKHDPADEAFIHHTAPHADLDFGACRIGGIIGIAEIVDCVTAHDSPWFFGRYGFVLANARRIDFRPCKGALGFFTPDYSSVYVSRKKSLKPAAPGLFSSIGDGT